IVHGIDVSAYQEHIDWSKVASSGIKFAFIRAYEGETFDSRFTDNWSGSKAAGVMRGAYQFFRPHHDGAEQANMLCDKLEQLGAGDFAPVCDVETLDGQSTQTLANELQKWVQTVQSRTGQKPIIYC